MDTGIDISEEKEMIEMPNPNHYGVQWNIVNWLCPSIRRRELKKQHSAYDKAVQQWKKEWLSLE